MRCVDLIQPVNLYVEETMIVVPARFATISCVLWVAELIMNALLNSHASTISAKIHALHPLHVVIMQNVLCLHTELHVNASMDLKAILT